MPAGQAFALGGLFVDRRAAAVAALDGVGLLGCGHWVQKEKGPRWAGLGWFAVVVPVLSTLSRGVS